MAYEIRLMAERYVSDGMLPQEGDRERLVTLPGRHCIPIATSLPHSPVSNLDLRLKDKPAEQYRGPDA